MECILSIIESFNDNYSTAVLCAVSIVTLLYVLKEHKLNKHLKIFVIPISDSLGNGGFNFFATLKNVGSYPAKVNPKK